MLNNACCLLYGARSFHYKQRISRPTPPMRKHIVTPAGRLLRVLATGGVLFSCATGILPQHAIGADFNAGAPSTARIWLNRTKEHKFLLRATALGGATWLVLDTGAPVTCADEKKTALFKFQPFPRSMQPPLLIMNGQQARMTLIPQMNFGGLALNNIPAVLVDLSGMNQVPCSTAAGLPPMAFSALTRFAACTQSSTAARARFFSTPARPARMPLRLARSPHAPRGAAPHCPRRAERL